MSRFAAKAGFRREPTSHLISLLFLWRGNAQIPKADGENRTPVCWVETNCNNHYTTSAYFSFYYRKCYSMWYRFQEEAPYCLYCTLLFVWLFSYIHIFYIYYSKNFYKFQIILQIMLLIIGLLITSQDILLHHGR